MPVLKSLSFDRDQILMDNGFDPNDNSIQVRVSLSEIEYNHDGKEDFLLDSSSVETRILRGGTLRANDVDLNIEIYKVE